MIKRLAAVLDVPAARLAQEVDDRRVDPLTPITVKTAVHDDQVYYLQEHASEFPGVQIQQTYLRDYPYQSLAAQVLGYVGEISPPELKAKRQQRADYRMGDKIGKSGVEATLDELPRGRREPRRSGSTRSATPRGRSRSGATQARGGPCGSRSTSSSSVPPSGRSGTGSSWPATTSSTTWAAARSSRSTPATAPSARWRRTRPTSRRSTSAGSTPRSWRRS